MLSLVCSILTISPSMYYRKGATPSVYLSEEELPLIKEKKEYTVCKNQHIYTTYTTTQRHCTDRVHGVTA
jgi:hypothetical protein